MTKAKRIFIGVLLLAVIQISIGFAWLNLADSRDFNFGPPFLVMSGFLGVFISLVGIIWLQKRSKK